jgi:hypothetical protein
MGVCLASIAMLLLAQKPTRMVTLKKHKQSSRCVSSFYLFVLYCVVNSAITQFEAEGKEYLIDNYDAFEFDAQVDSYVHACDHFHVVFILQPVETNQLEILPAQQSRYFLDLM